MGAVQPVPAKTFDITNLVITYDNTTIIGVNSAKLSFDSDATTDDVGADGSVVVMVSNDQRGTIEVELVQSSPSIDFLSQQVLLFLSTKQFKACSLQDLNGTSQGNAVQAWVNKVADLEFGKETAARTFRIRLANAQIFAGGLSG